MSNYKVLIADNVSPECDRILRGRGIEVERAVGIGRDELLDKVSGVHGMVVRSAVTVDRSMIERMNEMRVIGRAGAGVDNIDVGAATERGVLVMNTPGGNTISAAEHTIAMLMSLLRRIPAADAGLRNGTWDRKSFTGTELMGKRVGIVGLGRIGREVAARLVPFGVSLAGYDPLLSPEAIAGLGLEPATFDELVEGVDILTLHVPLVQATRGMIGRAELARVKKGMILINCARGGVVDDAALLEALQSGRVGGAALDVFEQEPPTFPNPLLEHPSVIATPHIAASTREAQERVAVAIAEQIADYLQGEGAHGVVNAVGLENSLRAAYRPLMEAAARLGALLGQLVGDEGTGCRLTAYGPETTSVLRGLGAAFLAGMLRNRYGDKVNTINAHSLAEQAGISVITAGEKSHSQYSMLITAEASVAGKSRAAAVTLFGRYETRLVMLDGTWFDVRPFGPMVLFENEDRPGVLASVGRVLERHGLNIADVSLGRREGTGHALTIIRLDEAVNDAAMEELSALDAVRTVYRLAFLQ